MKTGRPECYIPSAETVSHNVKNVFVRVRQQIAKMLQVSLHSDMNDYYSLVCRNTMVNLASLLTRCQRKEKLYLGFSES